MLMICVTFFTLSSMMRVRIKICEILEFSNLKLLHAGLRFEFMTLDLNESNNITSKISNFMVNFEKFHTNLKYLLVFSIKTPINLVNKSQSH